jgi:hypothetical protein
MAEHATTATATTATKAFPAAGKIGVMASAKAAAGGMTLMQMLLVSRLMWAEVMVVMTFPQGFQNSMVHANDRFPIYRR